MSCAVVVQLDSIFQVVDTRFEVDSLVEGEKYQFRVSAVNAAGSTSEPSHPLGPVTAWDEVEPAKVNVDAEYRDAVVVKAGETFNIKAYTSGKPTPSVTWLKDNKEISSRSDLNIDVRNFKLDIFVILVTS